MAEHVDAQEARRRAVERMKANGHAPAQHNGHAPAATDPVNWAQIIAQQTAATELRFERQIAALKETLADLGAKKSGVISAGEVKALAEAMVPFLDERLRATAAPLVSRLDELESVCRSLVEWRARDGK